MWFPRPDHHIFLTKLNTVERFKDDIKKRIDETAKYILPNENTTDYAYMFIPADGLYQDLLNSRVGTLQINSKDLVSYAYTKKVMIVFPGTQLHVCASKKDFNDISRQVESHLEIYDKESI